MVGLRSRAKFELMMLRRSKSTYEVAEEILPRVSTWWHKFVTPVQGCKFRSADNEILLPQAQVASFGNRVIRGGVFQDLPTDLKIYVHLLQFPNMLTQLCAKFPPVIPKWVSVAGESRPEGALRKTDASLRWPAVTCPDRRPADHRQPEATTVQRTVSRPPAAARLRQIMCGINHCVDHARSIHNPQRSQTKFR